MGFCLPIFAHIPMNIEIGDHPFGNKLGLDELAGENLEAGSGFASRTLASLEHA